MLGHDRIELFEVLAEQIGIEPALAGAHPIHIALERIDLAVVAHVAIGMGQRPGREGIRAEPRVDQRQRARQARILEVLIVGRHLMRKQQSLVDNRVRGQTGDIEIFAPLDRRLAHCVFNPLADHIELPLKLGFIKHIAGDENLPHERLGTARHRPDRIALYRHIAPTQQPHAFFGNHLREELLALLPAIGLGRQEHHAHAILARIRQDHADITSRAFQKFMRNLKQNTRAVTGARVATLRAAVGQILKNLQALLDNRVGFLALNIDHKTHSARVFLVFRVIEALLRWKPGYRHHGNLVSLGRR
ncbi:hypothetical protein NITLEN_40336 [Nitrospira lenta]|uniref:Uncharacterized protein n=1 Tax=Nitrospira lenta TaxID=1436998 RepID=A0A330L7M9_9BACT|nr:hypothetical protein NITLEN_40336 [Nitrospira lenta]